MDGRSEGGREQGEGGRERGTDGRSNELSEQQMGGVREGERWNQEEGRSEEGTGAVLPTE